MGYNIRQEMERMVPELQYYKKAEIFSAKEIKKIIDRRREFETILESKKTLYGYLKYIEHEILLERIYKKRAEKIEKVEKRYIRKRVKSLFRKAERAFPKNTSISFSYLGYLLNVEDKESAIDIALSLPKKHFTDIEVWIYCAKTLRQVAEIDSSRALMLRAIRAVKNKEEILQAFIEMEKLYSDQDSEQVISVLKKEINQISILEKEEKKRPEIADKI